MRRILIALSACVVVLSSCQKEVSFDLGNNGGNGGTTSSLLTKMVITQGSDSTVTNYVYNSAKKLIAINATQDSVGGSAFNNQTIIRNAQGIIQKIIIKASDLQLYGIDSLVENVHYDAASSKYVSKAATFSLLGFTVMDSSYYTYSGGQIISEDDYTDDGTGLQKSTINYGFTGSNLTSLKAYDYNSGSQTLDLNQIFEYDNKTSPLILGNEAFVISNQYLWYSSNNLTKMTVNVTGDPQTHIETLTYTYNSSSKPVSAAVVADGQDATATYFYN